MRKLFMILVFLMVVIGTSALAGAQDSEPTEPAPIGYRPDAPAYAVHGPYWVGARDFTPEVAGRDEPLTMTVWYPALNPDYAEEAITYTDIRLTFDGIPEDFHPSVSGHALADAAADVSGAPYPLVVFSHGFAMYRQQYAYLTEHLASYGFVVIAPDHLDWFDENMGSLWSATIDRPQDIQKVIAYAETLTAGDGELAGLIDVNTIGVVGHSYGGYTALAAAGARFDLKAFNDRCASLAADDPNRTLLCDPLVPREADMAARIGVDPMLDGLWASWGDPRVKAIVPLSGDSYIFGDAGLAEITVPVMAMVGTLDVSTPPDWGALPTYANVSSEKKALVQFVNGEHEIFMDDCVAINYWDELGIPSLCSSQVWDMYRMHDLVDHLTTAFLLDTLKLDATAHAALAPDAVVFPGVTYESTGF